LQGNTSFSGWQVLCFEKPTEKLTWRRTESTLRLILGKLWRVAGFHSPCSPARNIGVGPEMNLLPASHEDKATCQPEWNRRRAGAWVFEKDFTIALPRHF
jgi:hypothetical protein